MSWDIFIQDIPEGATSAGDIPDDFEPRPLGSRSDIVRRIREVVPAAHFSDPSWGSFDGPDFSIEFSIGDDEEVTSFAMHVRGGDIAAGVVADLLNQCGWRAFDPGSDSGMFDPGNASESLNRWRAYRDRVVADENAG
jgi:hypothetical protein